MSFGCAVCHMRFAAVLRAALAGEAGAISRRRSAGMRYCASFT